VVQGKKGTGTGLIRRAKGASFSQGEGGEADLTRPVKQVAGNARDRTTALKAHQYYN